MVLGHNGGTSYHSSRVGTVGAYPKPIRCCTKPVDGLVAYLGCDDA